MSEEPKRAVAGKLRTLSIEPVMSRTKVKTEIFCCEEVIINFYLLTLCSGLHSKVVNQAKQDFLAIL